ncbi:insecticidal delta-endotoxin Cry8Ea1 family protein [Vibrio sp. zbq_19]|uniref:insecticidal delta-endotoxin Cry8Ea1 family protein n=1 Tax=Vibrio TaxID=662 RepID=UPI001482BAA4|nr:MULTISPECIES: insecticidal delta-endotoxin Cry8Ea1 family protein [Vibrio]MBS9976895.1 hypothetical protein [Vibrio alginolyticus]MBT0023061.1 hypothetical protein [Vibrio alginolyticus]NNN59241.1 hypothetical protein [Vibrio sp. 1-2 (7-a)]
MTTDSSFCNVLANSPSQDSSSFDSFSSTFNQLTDAWKTFSKNGDLKVLNEHLKLAWDTSQTGQVDFTALARASISLIGLVPGAGPVLPFINMFTGFIFPKIFGGSSGEDANQAYFELIMKQVKSLVDNEFRDFTLNDLTSYLNSIEGALKEFQREMQVAIGNSEGPDVGIRAAEDISKDNFYRVNRQFYDAKQTIEDALPHFKNPKLSKNDADFNAETVMLTLPMYTNVATLDLILIQGYITFATKYKSTLDESKEINSLRGLLQTRIKEYTETISDTFYRFLPSLTKDRKDSYIKYNRYVRCMTLQCFDIVSTWPALDDAYYYNISFKSDQTRLVFNDIVGPWEGNDNIVINVIDIFSPVSYGIGFKESSDVRNFTYKKMELNSAGFNNYFHKTKGVEHGYCNGIKLQYGNTTISAGENNSLSTVSSPMTYINVTSQNSMYLDYSLVSVDGNSVAGSSPIGNRSTSQNTALSNQKINAIYPVQSNDKPEKHADNYMKWGFISSHVPFDLYPENYIGDLDEENNVIHIIKGFPLEKGDFNTEVRCVNEPINSASAVNLKQNQTVTLKIINNITHNYKVRVRYACDQDVLCSVSVSNNNWCIDQDTIVFPNTKDPHHDNPPRMFVSGKTGNYVLKNILNFNVYKELKEGTVHISITNKNEHDIFLDRIEVIS